jgi:hypothetical protein
VQDSSNREIIDQVWNEVAAFKNNKTGDVYNGTLSSVCETIVAVEK